MIEEKETYIVPKEELKKYIEKLKKFKFSDFKIHPYFYSKAYPKHGIDEKEAEKIFSQFDKIVYCEIRKSKRGKKYSFKYKLSKTHSIVLCFFLDEVPPKFFNAFHDYKDIDKWIKRKYYGV